MTGAVSRCPPRSAPLALVVLLAVGGCASERGPRPAEELVTWSGYVLGGPASTEEDVLAEGAVEFLTGEGEGVAAEAPYADYPGYWTVDLPPGIPVDVRVEAEGAWPALWAATTPSADASWFLGALFGARADSLEAFLAAMPTPPTLPDVDLDDPSQTHLIGSAWDGEAWDCAALTVNGEPPLCWLYDEETGAALLVDEGPVTWFAALHLTPGEVTLDSGIGGAHTWTAAGGEMVYAFWFQGAP